MGLIVIFIMVIIVIVIIKTILSNRGNLYYVPLNDVGKNY